MCNHDYVDEDDDDAHVAATANIAVVHWLCAYLCSSRHWCCDGRQANESWEFFALCGTLRDDIANCDIKKAHILSGEQKERKKNE